MILAADRAPCSYQVTLRRKEEGGDDWQAILRACHKRCSERTLKAMEQNGSIFIKLGQHLSSMNYLLPEEWTTTFIPLQDHCPVSSYESVADLVLKDTGAPIEDYFEDFAREPIGAASLAQVHLATMRETGQKVAVKIQHPALAEWVPLDLSLTRLTFSTLKRFFPEYDLEWLSNEMEASLPQELDFALEGENALRTREHFLGLPNSPLVVPNVLWGMKRILVMENVAGHRIDDLEYLDFHGIDRDEVSAALAHVFNEMIFGDTPLHCDPHGGNVAIRENKGRRKPNFDIILYDHGLYRVIPKQLRRDYAKLWLAVIDADEKKMRKYAHDVAEIDDDQFPLFASAITGRDYTTLTQSVVSTRSEEEKEAISESMGEGMLQQVWILLVLRIHAD
jgi:aarF domain-containing kinase